MYYIKYLNNVKNTVDLEAKMYVIFSYLNLQRLLYSYN